MTSAICSRVKSPVKGRLDAERKRGRLQRLLMADIAVDSHLVDIAVDSRCAVTEAVDSHLTVSEAVHVSNIMCNWHLDLSPPRLRDAYR